MSRSNLNEAFCFEDDEFATTMMTSTLKTSPHDAHNTPDKVEEEEEELEEQRQDIEDESIALARQLMAEEAMASYQSSFQLLDASQFSTEDYQAMQAAMMEDDDEQLMQLNEDDEEEAGNAYETLLDLSERIGDVKSERWAWRAPQEIAKLPFFVHQPTKTTRDDSECKCLVCQCEYETGEQLCRLPCQHTFHADCVKPWLMKKDICPYCRQSIVAE